MCPLKLALLQATTSTANTKGSASYLWDLCIVHTQDNHAREAWPTPVTVLSESLTFTSFPCFPDFGFTLLSFIQLRSILQAVPPLSPCLYPICNLWFSDCLLSHFLCSPISLRFFFYILIQHYFKHHAPNIHPRWSQGLLGSVFILKHQLLEWQFT